MTKTVLEEEQERLRTEIEEARKREDDQQREEIEQENIQDKEEAKPEPEVVAEEKKHEVEQEDDEHPAKKRLRRKEEKRMAEQLAAQLAEANARILELTRSREDPRQVSDEPSRADDPQAWTEWKVQQQERELSEFKQWKAQQEQARNYQERIRQAESEIIAFENQVRDKLPAYDEAKSYIANYEAFNIKRERPNITQDQLVEAVKLKMMTRAAYFLKEGYENPIEAMYEEAKTLGFSPKKNDDGERKRPDLDKVAKNHARNAGMAGAAAGTGSGEMTPRYVAENLTVAETAKMFAKMTPEEKRNFYKRLA